VFQCQPAAKLEQGQPVCIVGQFLGNFLPNFAFQGHAAKRLGADPQAVIVVSFAHNVQEHPRVLPADAEEEHGRSSPVSGVMEGLQVRANALVQDAQLRGGEVLANRLVEELHPAAVAGEAQQPAEEQALEMRHHSVSVRRSRRSVKAS